MAELLTFERFVELESRVRKIEKHLRLDEPVPGPVATNEAVVAVLPLQASQSLQSDTAIDPPQPVVPLLSELAVVPPPLPVIEEVPEELSTAEKQFIAPEETPMNLYTRPPAISPGVIAYEPQLQRPLRKDSQSSVERWIGLNWTGWIGAIVLVIGAALGIKYAYDQGWLSILPKEVRLAMCFMAGVGLLGLGEWIDRRVNRISAACVLGAGVATLFVVSYAGFGYFQLYGHTMAFVLMAISTVTGSVIALRKNLVTIAALSLIGGNLAPIILQTHEPRYAALLGYILALQIVSLLLASLGRGSKWWILRGVAIVMPALWVMVVFGLAGATTTPVVFSAVYAILLQAELIVASGRRARIQPGQPGPTSLIVTTLLSFAVMTGLQNHPTLVQGGALLLTAALCGLGALALYRTRDELAFSFRIQAALLVLVSVPVMLQGEAIVLAWGGLAVAYAIIGAKLKSPWGRWIGVAAWAGAALYLGMWATTTPAAQHVLWLDQPRYLFMAAGLTVLGHALSCVIIRQTDSSAVEALCNALDAAAGLVLAVAMVVALPQWYATGAIAAYGWLMFAAAKPLRRDSWTIVAGAALVLAVLKWATVDTIGMRLAPSYQANRYLPVVNPVMGVGTLLAGSIVAVYALRRDDIDQWLRRHGAGSPVVGVMSLVLLMMTFALSMEVDRTVSRLAAARATPWPAMQLGLLGLTMLWTFALALHSGLLQKIAGDPADRHRRLRANGRSMLALAVKFIVFDTLLWYASNGPVNVLPGLNFQVLAGIIVALGLGLHWWMLDREGFSWRVGGAMVLALLLLVGSLEIDRAFERSASVAGFFDNAGLAKQVALNIYWAGFAVTAISLGFRLRIAGLRYCGLALLAISLGKVVFVDLQHLDRGYRVLSFLALGGLLLGTSVAYGKLSPKVLEESSTEA